MTIDNLGHNNVKIKNRDSQEKHFLQSILILKEGEIKYFIHF